MITHQAPRAAVTCQTSDLKMDDLVAQVKRYAAEHYDEGGCGVVTETYTGDEIRQQIGKARILKGALRKFAPLISIWAEREADARESAF